MTKIDPATTWTEISCIGFGCWQAMTWRRGWHIPIGVVWFSASTYDEKTTIHIGQSWVCDDMRRQGVRTLIHQAIIEHLKPIKFVTGISTKDGRAWLKATGFHFNKDAGQWVLNLDAVRPRIALEDQLSARAGRKRTQ